MTLAPGVGAPAPPRRLDSWKEIAGYLHRGLSTVQRWEQEEGLPVHRHQHAKGGSVYAFTHELDAWWGSRSARLTGDDGAQPVAPVAARPAEHMTAAPEPFPRRWFAMAGTVGAVVLAALSIAVFWNPRPATAPRVSQHFNLDLPADAPLAPVSAMPNAGDKMALALSPDGRWLVYSGERGDGLQLMACDLSAEGRVVTLLPGTQGGYSPFFSRDGRKLGFFARGKLWTMALPGGAPTALAEALNPWGGSWGEDGVIFFNPSEGAGIFKVNPASGRVESVLAINSVLMPQPLMPGRGLVASFNGETIWTRNGRNEGALFEGIGARYAESGHLVYALPGTLMARRFDRATAVAAGDAVALARDLRTAPYAVAQFALSREGTLVYVPGTDQGRGRFVLVDANGARQKLTTPEALFFEFSLSPDGSRLAAAVDDETGDPGTDIWIYDLARAGSGEKLPDSARRKQGVTHLSPKWAPDGEHLLYCELVGSSSALVWTSVKGGDRAILWPGPGATNAPWIYPMNFSPDGRSLAVFAATKQKMDLFILPIRRADGSLIAGAPLVPYLATPAAEAFGQFSPSGDAMVYQSDASGASEIYFRRYPVDGRACKVSENGGMDPSWAANGREIHYQSGTAVYAVRIESLADCRLSQPRQLFDGFPDRLGFGHDVAPDGRWLMLENDDYAKPVHSLKVITNLFDELGRRAVASGGRR